MADSRILTTDEKIAIDLVFAEFRRDHGAALVGAGWDRQSVFGTADPAKSLNVDDVPGVIALLMAGGRVEKIAQDRIFFSQADGSITTWHRGGYFTAADLSEDAPPTPTDRVEDFGERATLIEYGADLPEEWAQGLARLCVMPRPDDLNHGRWQDILIAAGHFADLWAAKANRLGWTTVEIFGIHQTEAQFRFGSMGLVVVLGHPKVMLVDLDAEQATIRSPHGVIQYFHRKEFAADKSPRRLLWEDMP